MCFSYWKNSLSEQYTVQTVVNDRPLLVECWDIQGAYEDYPKLRPLGYPETSCFLLCFDLMNPDSLEQLYSDHIPEIRRYTVGVPCILVGLKKDLVDNYECVEKLLQKGQSPVSKKQAIKFAKQMKCAAYIECSSLTGENVYSVFELAVKISMTDAKSNNAQNKNCSVQ